MSEQSKLKASLPNEPPTTKQPVAPLEHTSCRLDPTVGTYHTLIIGDCVQILPTLPAESVALIITSPCYYNAEHDTPNYYQSYEQYQEVLRQVAKESIRVLGTGRIFALNIDDMRVDGKLYPIVADATTIFLKAGYDYRARITWVKPKGFALRQRQSGLAVKYPYPMYAYFSNLTESILLFQKGRFDYRSVSQEQKQTSKIDRDKWSKEWNLNVWNICNVLPVKGRIDEHVASFPDEIPGRLIDLFSYRGETILDMFAGSGTTMKVARQLERNSVGIEINKRLLPVIRKKIKTAHATTPASFIIVERLTPSNIPSPNPINLPPQSTVHQVPLTLFNEQLREG